MFDGMKAASFRVTLFLVCGLVPGSVSAWTAQPRHWYGDVLSPAATGGRAGSGQGPGTARSGTPGGPATGAGGPGGAPGPGDGILTQLADLFASAPSGGAQGTFTGPLVVPLPPAGLALAGALGSLGALRWSRRFSRSKGRGSG